MPHIRVMRLGLDGRHFDETEQRLRARHVASEDELPIVSSVAEIAEIVRRTEGPCAFRVADDPQIVTVWEPHGGDTVVIYTLYRWRLCKIDAILASERLPTSVCDTMQIPAAAIAGIEGNDRPTLVSTPIFESGSIGDVLCMIAYVPAACEMWGME